MTTFRSAVALLALACAEPTAIPRETGAPPVRQASVVTSSFSIDAANRTLYVRLASPRPDDAEPVHAFMRRMFASADSAGVKRMVVDLRGVTGGDARLLVPLLRGVASREQLARSGGLYVVVGDASFSPGQSAATLLARYAQPRFVTEAPR
jgi:hypothetical protein